MPLFNNAFISFHILGQKRASKVLSDERSDDLGGGFTLYYGTQDADNSSVVEINVKGFFAPTSSRPGLQADASRAARALQRRLCDMLDGFDGTGKYYIVSTDFTERGLKVGKGCKMKYQMFVMPKACGPIESQRGLVMSIAEKANKSAEDVLDGFGFKPVCGIGKEC